MRLTPTYIEIHGLQPEPIEEYLPPHTHQKVKRDKNRKSMWPWIVSIILLTILICIVIYSM